MKKRIIYLLLCVCMVLTAAPMAAMAEETQAAPVEIAPTYDWYDAEKTAYEIDSIEDLAGLAKLTQDNVVIDETTTLTKTDFANKTVKLTADLTFAEGQYWYYNDGTTVYNYIIGSFAGEFDGNNKTISNMRYIKSADSQTLSLFEKIIAGGSVKDLTIDTVNVTTTGATFSTVVGTLNGTAYNCHAKNVTVTSTGVLNVYGFGSVSGATASADKCTVDGLNITNTLVGNQTLGGSGFGSCTNGSITNCSVKNLTTVAHGESKYQGFGNFNGGTCKSNSVENAELTVKSTCKQVKEASGFGNITGSITVEDCHVKNLHFKNEGSVSLYIVGGFAYRSISGVSFKNCTVTDVTFTAAKAQQLAGFVAEVKGGAFESCSVTNITMNLGSEDIPGTQTCVGGFIGQSRDAQTTIKNCHVNNLQMNLNGTVGSDTPGGFIAQAAGNTTFTNCSVDGYIKATAKNENSRPVGGFAGNFGWGTGSTCVFTECTADVDITATGPAGGFMGQVKPQGTSSTTNATFTDCEAKGDVTSTNGTAGGFAAIGDSGNFENCTATGDVVGATAGGFIGEIKPNKGGISVSIESCTAGGQVLGTDTASGFVGSITTSGENDTNTTTVTVSNSTAAPVVAGATKDTNVVDFAEEIVPENSTSHYTSSENSDAEATITVKDEASGGAVTMNNGVITVPSGTKVELKTETETKTFENGTNITVNNNQVVFVPTVTFDANGGSSDFTSADVEADGTLASLPDAEKDYYDFAGWFTAEGNKVDADTKFTENTTVYAEWEAKSYSVTLDVNGGSVNNADDVTEYTYGIGAALPENVTKVGYLFAGWFENEACEGDAVTEIATDDFGAKTFYAKWVECGHDNMQLVNTDPEGHYNECSECGYESDKTEHDYTVLKTSAGEHWYECSVCRAEDTANRASHSGGTAYCTAKAVCTVCNTAYGELDADNHASNGYTYTDCGLTHAKLHSCCGEREVYEGHTYEEGSCICGASEPAKEDSNACEVIADIVEIAHEIVWRNLALHIINAITSIFG